MSSRRQRIVAGAVHCPLSTVHCSLFTVHCSHRPLFTLSTVHCPLFTVHCPMKLLLAILAILLVAASLFADYKWRRWMAARKAERDRNPNP